MCADFDAQQPVRALAVNFTTEVANSAGTTINPSEDYAQGSTTSGQNGVLSMGAVTTAAPTYITGTSNPLSLDTSGNLRVTIDSSVSEQNVNLNQVGGAAFALGQTTMANSLPVTIASNQSPLSINEAQLNGVALGSPSAYGTSPGAVSVQGVNAFITNTVPVTLASTTITGTVAVTQSTSPWVVSLASTTITGTVTVAGNLTNNNAAPAANNIGVLPAVASAAAPTWTTGDQVLLSEDLSGNLRVITGSGSTTVVTGTVAENLTQVGGSAIALGQTTMSASLPVTIASNQSTLNTKDAADGPVTPGAVAANSQLAGGQYNSTPPTLTTGQQVALQVDANGRLLVDAQTVTSITPVLTYFTDASVATSATVTHSLAGPITLDKIDATASGEIKLTVAIGITGSEVTYWNGFSSASNQDIEFALPYGYVIPTGSSVKITIKNRDTAAQDVYATIFSH